MGTDSIRAFSDGSVTYYKTTQAIGFLPKGTTFYHDKEDNVYGSISEGCLKLCWTEDGDCPGNSTQKICGGTVVFHYAFVKTDLFEKIEFGNESRLKKIINELEENLRVAKDKLNSIK